MNIADFDFDLPDSQIAQVAVPRGESRLLVLDRRTGRIAHTQMARIGEFLRAGDLLVANDTRVFPARLLGRRTPSTGAVECLLMGTGRPVEAEPGAEEWDALVHPGQKLKPGARMVFGGAAGVGTGRAPSAGQGAIDARDTEPSPVLHGEVLARRFHGRRTVRLWTADGSPVERAIDALGHVPLPPYIDRPDTAADRERYQTVYARARGSIAAPTAGLHFSDALLASLAAQGVERAYVTLHVGYGTFKPVRVEQVEAHTVDPESYEVTAGTADALTRTRREGRRVIAVGTTTARVLETLALAPDGAVLPSRGETGTFIYPGHTFRMLDGLLTNFHLPKSSLLLLVCAFGGTDRVLAAYREAVREGYRFYSYGDAMLVV